MMPIATIFTKATAIIAVLFMGAAAALAGEVNTLDSGLAIQGYDPVAYFDGEVKDGSEAFSVTHDGATYRFSSEANRARFAANPEQYLPAYGGWCAYGMAKGYKAPVDPTAYSIVDGQLYLNFSKGVQTIWNTDRPGYIEQADANWPTVKSN